MTQSTTVGAARGDRDVHDLAVPLHWRASGVSVVEPEHLRQARPTCP
jgi:hypothetical protein